MTGFGRTWRWFGVDHWKVVPDILVSAKGASAGYYPLGIVLVGADLVDEIREGAGGFSHGFTYANGVMGAAVGLAVLNYLHKHELVAASACRGSHLLQALQSLRDLPCVGDVRGLGLMAGVERVESKASEQPFPGDWRIAERVRAAALKKGVNVYCSTGLVDGFNGDALLLGPPFFVDENEIDEICATLRAAIVEATD
jgi:adenosylmethionine-8-amino-7-oxononanoate aminotransferase